MSEANWYTNVFKSWQAKLLGPKPSGEVLAQVHMLGLRPGKQALANAMYMREGGATSSQVVMACGAPQLNRMRDLITDKLVKRVPVSPAGDGHQVYKIELTAKGHQRIDGAVKRAAEAEATADKPAKAPSKAKGKPKAKRAAKVAADETPTSEAPSLIEQAPAEQPPAEQPQA